MKGYLHWNNRTENCTLIVKYIILRKLCSEILSGTHARAQCEHFHEVIVNGENAAK